ncbi:MAG: DUF1194 domain-containing protein [Rhodospirillales bacterium]
MAADGKLGAGEAGMRRLTCLALSGFLLLGSLGGARAQSQPVDIELLLAVDSSSSIDRNEFDQQMRGLAEAFRSPLVGSAIEALGQSGGVAVALMQWSGRDHQHLSAPWRLLRSREDAEAFADLLDSTPRFIDGGSTALGEALRVGLQTLTGNLYDGRRLVIDVSGDGISNEGEEPAVWRDRLVAAGITINALAILNEDPNLLEIYREQVIGGPQAFALSAVDYEAYGAAIEYKLLQELGPPQFVQDRSPR